MSLIALALCAGAAAVIVAAALAFRARRDSLRASRQRDETERLYRAYRKLHPAERTWTDTSPLTTVVYIPDSGTRPVQGKDLDKRRRSTKA